MTPDSVELLIDWIYDSLEGCLNFTQAVDLFKAGHKLDIADLWQHCERILKAYVSHETCLQVANLAMDCHSSLLTQVFTTCQHPLLLKCGTCSYSLTSQPVCLSVCLFVCLSVCLHVSFLLRVDPTCLAATQQIAASQIDLLCYMPATWSSWCMASCRHLFAVNALVFLLIMTDFFQQQYTSGCELYSVIQI